MRTQVTLIIDNPSRWCYHGRVVSRGSGYRHGRARQGVHPRKVRPMIQVVNRGETFAVRLACKMCGERCRLEDLWLGFPPGEAVQGEWLHRRCADGHVQELFGTRRIVMMRGIDAIRRLAEALQDVDDDPALARQRPRVRAKA
jgi:hypothetical protein